MGKLIITRGLPASGKSTWAKAWVAEEPTNRARVNRDDYRSMMFGGWTGDPDHEKAVTVARDAAVSALLKRGLDVVCDDTNLRQRFARDLRKIAVLAGAEFGVKCFLGTVSVDECVRRDKFREALVGEDVIRGMWEKFGRNPYPLPLVDESAHGGVEPYAPVPGTPTAVMVDIDGTVALMGTRSPYDETRVHEDRPNTAVIEAVVAMHKQGHKIIFCSGRTAACRTETGRWIDKHIPANRESLFMRNIGDMRKDAVVKAEIFDKYIRNHYTIVGVFDDRNQVVDMWRSMGLTVFQVAPGGF